MTNTIARPLPGEYAPYAIMYIQLVPEDGQVLQHLASGLEAIRELTGGLTEEQLSYRYAPGKWDLKEMLVHIIDSERIFCYRALCIARKDQTELPGFEQDDYAMNSMAGERSLQDIMHEYATVRQATLSLFNSFDDAAFTRMGKANKHPVSVRALAYMIAGHERHHLDIIKERYLS